MLRYLQRPIIYLQQFSPAFRGIAGRVRGNPPGLDPGSRTARSGGQFLDSGFRRNDE